MKKNEIYVLKQPTRVTTSLIIVDETFPLNPKIHENMDLLSSKTNVILIFSDEFFPESKKIDKNKFASLYGACAWIETENSLPNTFFKVLLYCREVFTGIIGYNISNLSSLAVDNYPINRILKIVLSKTKIESPVLEINRLSGEDMYEFYKLPENEEKNKSFFKKLFGKKDNVNRKLSGMFCSYHSPSDFIILTDYIVDLFLTFQKEDNTKNFIESFKEKSDIRFLIASLIKYLGIENIKENEIQTKWE